MPQMARISRRTIHHVWPSSRGGTNDRRNLVKLDGRWHDTLHAVFGNATPDEYFGILNADPKLAIRRLIKAIIRNFGVSAIRDALR